MEQYLQVQHIKKQFESQKAVDDISFSIKKGSYQAWFTFLTGHTGSIFEPSSMWISIAEMQSHPPRTAC
jgi:ABC-type ATPase involved in cell division